jgi:hypothetical protein
LLLNLSILAYFRDDLPFLRSLILLEDDGLIVATTDCEHEANGTPAALQNWSLKSVFVHARPLVVGVASVNSEALALITCSYQVDCAPDIIAP